MADVASVSYPTPVLTGRLNTGDETERKLGNSWDTGGHLALLWTPFHIEVLHSHLVTRSELGDLDILTAQFCGHFDIWGLCLDGRYGRGKGTDRGSNRTVRNVSSYYGGVAFGVRFPLAGD